MKRNKYVQDLWIGVIFCWQMSSDSRRVKRSITQVWEGYDSSAGEHLKSPHTMNVLRQTTCKQSLPLYTDLGTNSTIFLPIQTEYCPVLLLLDSELCVCLEFGCFWKQLIELMWKTRTQVRAEYQSKRNRGRRPIFTALEMNSWTGGVKVKTKGPESTCKFRLTDKWWRQKLLLIYR